MGGENQKSSLTHDTGYSAKAQFTGKPSYLEPISHSMQKTIEGLSLLVFSAVNGMLKKPGRTYLERIRNRMHVPIEGLLANRLHCLIKREGVSNREQQFSSKQAARKHKKVQTATRSTQPQP